MFLKIQYCTVLLASLKLPYLFTLKKTLNYGLFRGSKVRFVHLTSGGPLIASLFSRFFFDGQLELYSKEMAEGNFIQVFSVSIFSVYNTNVYSWK